MIPTRRATVCNPTASCSSAGEPQRTLATAADLHDKETVRVSVELIPRGEGQVYSDAVTVRSVMPAADGFNIPDLMRFPLRSWEACAITSSVLPASIPHVRAIDIPPGDELSVGDAIIAAGLSEVLVIKGDAPSDLSRRTYPNTSEAPILELQAETSPLGKESRASVPESAAAAGSPYSAQLPIRALQTS